jgi:hypothetical protein
MFLLGNVCLIDKYEQAKTPTSVLSNPKYANINRQFHPSANFKIGVAVSDMDTQPFPDTGPHSVFISNSRAGRL